MNAEEYIDERLDDQISWYDKKSLASQRWYKRLRMVEFVAAALIPFLVGYLAPETTATKIVIGLLGVAIAVITGTLGLCQFQERWIEYRTTCESLKKEKYLFLTESDPYDGEVSARFRLLVQRVESLVSKENTSWAQYMMRRTEDVQHDED